MTLVEGFSKDEAELSPEETQALLEEQTQKYLGISLEKFYELAEQGQLPEHPAVPHLVLMSGARPTSC